MSDPFADAFALVASTKSMREHDPRHVHRTFRDVFGSDAGQRVLVWLVQETGAMTRNEGVCEDIQARFMAGQRSVVQMILQKYSIAPPDPQKLEPEVSPLDRK